MRPMLAFVPLAQFIFCFGVSVIALSGLSYLLYRQSKFSERLISVPIMVNICTWCVAMCFDLCYTSSSITSWLNAGEWLWEVNAAALFWSGATFFAATTAVSVTVFFLLLDRCLILVGPSWLNENSKRWLHRANALLVVVDFFFVMWIFVEFEKPDYIQNTSCQTFSCVSDGHGRSLNIIRMVYGTINTITASVFFVLLMRYNKRREHELKPQGVTFTPGAQQAARSMSQRSNIIAGINVLSQIAFNFLPNLAAFIALEAFGIALSSNAGPVVSTSGQIDALVTTIVYWTVLGDRIMKGKSVRSTVAPITTVITSK